MNDTRRPKLSRDEVVGIVGNLDDYRIAEIIASGASAAEVAEAFAWHTSEEYLGPDPHHRLGGRVAQVYDILTADQYEDDEDTPQAQ